MRKLPEEVLLMVEAYAVQIEEDPNDLWAYMEGRKPWPPGLREGMHAALKSLTSERERTKVRSSMLAGIDRRRKVGRPLDLDHPFTAWLAANNVTVTEWAAAHQYSRERVKLWFAEKGGRPIPRAAADTIERESTDPGMKPAVPATRRTWKNGIRE